MEPIKIFNKVAGHINDIQKSVLFLYTSNEFSTNKIKKTFTYSSNQNNEIPINKHNQGERPK